eukprot:3185978-Prymnesium_polylepis.1
MQESSAPDMSTITVSDSTAPINIEAVGGDGATAPATEQAASSSTGDVPAGAEAPPVASAAPAATAKEEEDTIVQFIVVRRDWLKTLEWPVGSVIAQACHASTAVMFEHRDDAAVTAYLGKLDSMYKVVKEVKGEPQLLTLAEKLRSEGIAHKVWLEQPENMPTAIALKPYPRSQVAPLLKKYQLFK